MCDKDFVACVLGDKALVISPSPRSPSPPPPRPHPVPGCAFRSSISLVSHPVGRCWRKEESSHLLVTEPWVTTEASLPTGLARGLFPASSGLRRWCAVTRFGDQSPASQPQLLVQGAFPITQVGTPGTSAQPLGPGRGWGLGVKSGGMLRAQRPETRSGLQCPEVGGCSASA